MFFCCDLFRESFENTGKTGISFVIKKFGESYCFFLQSRACEFDQMNLLKNFPSYDDCPKPFSIVVQQALLFCPYCGTATKSVVGKNSDVILQLYKSNEKFVL